MRLTYKFLTLGALFLGAVPALAQSTQDRLPRPIELGVSGGSIDDLDNPFCCGGTLGCLVQNAAGDLFILSNNHVLTRSNRATIGEGVVQPGLIDVGCAMILADVVADLSDFVPLDFGGGITAADAAIAQVRAGAVDTSGSILNVGPLSPNTVGAFIGQNVKKSGRTTGLTFGQVGAIDVSVNVSYSKSCGRRGTMTASYVGQVRITPGTFSDGGDSGSCIVEDVANSPRAMGLLFAGSSSSTIANPMDDVLNALNVTMVGGDPPPPPTTGSITGTVTSSVDGSAIAGADVSTDTGQATTTASNGTYSLTNVPTGDRTVSASSSGFGSANQTVTVNENQTSLADFALDPVVGGSQAIVDCVTYTTSGGPGGDKHLNITVSVVDDQGNPVAGASVSVDVSGPSAGTATGTTDDNGNVTFGAKNAGNGCYHTTATGVSASGLNWDGATPANGFDKGNDATPDADCRSGGDDCGGAAFGGVAQVPGPRFAPGQQVNFASPQRFAGAVIVKRRHEDALFARDSAVLGVGVGHVNGQPVIEIYIDDQLQVLPAFPGVVENFPVHVIPTDPFVAY
jgi:hypothetical protein